MSWKSLIMLFKKDYIREGKQMKRLIVGLLVVIVAMAGCGKARKKEIINIGINQLVEFEALDQCREGSFKHLRIMAIKMEKISKLIIKMPKVK